MSRVWPIGKRPKISRHLRSNGRLKTMVMNYWMSPETRSVNPLPMLNIEHIEKISLDGAWRFQLLRSPSDRIGKKWSSIPVPGLRREQPPFLPTLNPHRVYERDFELPESWKDKRIVIHLGGYESLALVFINGLEIALTKGSRLAAEFDITKFVHPGVNLLRIDVRKSSDTTSREEENQWWHGGITHSVKLFATNKVFIEHFYTTAGVERDGTTGTLNIRAGISSVDNLSIYGYTLRTSIEELTKVKSAHMQATMNSSLPSLASEGNEGQIELNTRILNIKAWSAETPQLYTLNIELCDPSGKVVEISSQRIGFRSVKIVGRDLLINGKAVIFYGINCNDFNRYTGRALTRNDMREELLELKRRSFNALRTSHFTNDAAFLDLCDELGFYVIAEANVQSQASISKDPKYLTALVDRVSRMIQRDIHHPAAIMWSLGDDSGAGVNYEAAAAYARALDSTRPLHQEGGFNWEPWNHGPLQRISDGSSRHALGGDYGEANISTAKASTGNFKIFNKNFFKDLSEHEVRWSIICDGLLTDSGRVKLPKVGARKTIAFKVKSTHLTKVDGFGERFINFSIICTVKTSWSQAWSEVGWNQMPLTSRALVIKAAKRSDLFTQVIDDHGQIVMPYGVVAPVLSLWRAPTDNDLNEQISTQWELWGLRDLERTDCVVSQSASSVKISHTWQTGTGITVQHSQTISPVADGFRVKESVLLPKQLHDVARVGTHFELDAALSDLTWFGSGPHETYPDRSIARINRYVSTVESQYTPYVRPQENGGHTGVRWFELTNATGHGVRIQLSKPLQVSVTPNRAVDLADATHDADVRACANAVVHIDAAHRGVGTASCRPDKMATYKIKPGAHTWEWILTSIPN